MFRSGYGEVASMDEDVAIWDRRLRVVSIVGVRDANDMDFVCSLVFIDKLGWRSVKSSREEKKRR